MERKEIDLPVITLNEFLCKEVRCCFKCGSKKYKDIMLKDHLFRLCKKCEKSQDVVAHFMKLIKG